MKRTSIACTFVFSCAVMAAVMVSSCKKEDAPLSISLSIPAAGISISQGQTADVQFTVDNIPEGGGISRFQPRLTTMISLFL